MANLLRISDAPDRRMEFNLSLARKVTFERKGGVIVSAEIIYSADHIETFVGTSAPLVYKAFTDEFSKEGAVDIW